MPPSAVGANRLAGQALTHALVVHDRHTSESTVMWARDPTRKSTVAIRSSKEIPSQRRGARRRPGSSEDPQAAEGVAGQLAELHPVAGRQLAG